MTILLPDSAITNNNQDYFNVEERLVKPLFDFITDEDAKPCAVALIGEWGSGKTSVINLLKKRLHQKIQKKRKNIILNFEPLLDGKFELFELIELFYLKLYASIGNRKARSLIKKSLTSLLLAIRGKIGVNTHLANLEYDLGKNIDDILSVWRKKAPAFLSDQLRELGGKLKNHHLYIFVDEIDRLPGNQILNFLLFARIMENLNSSVCIFAMDYKRMLTKLVKEGALGLCNYELATSYLDKLFQVRFDVCNFIDENQVGKYVRDGLKKLGIEQEILPSENDLQASQEKIRTLAEIISYLPTPRHIKKWLMNIKAKLIYVKAAEDKLAMLGFIAAYTKHPIIMDNCVQHTLPLFFKAGQHIDFSQDKDALLQDAFSKKYTISLKQAEQLGTETILLATMGVLRNCQKNEREKKDVITSISPLCLGDIQDKATIDLIKRFWKNTPYHFIFPFIVGHMNEDILNLYSNFFSNKIDTVVEKLCGHEKFYDVFIQDIVRNVNITELKNKPNIGNLNTLWKEKVGNFNGMLFNPYGFLITQLIKLHDPKDVISTATLSLSEIYLAQLLATFGIKNKEARYDLNDYKAPEPSELEKYDAFKNNAPKGCEDIENLLKLWIKRVENSLEKEQSLLGDDGIISVFYRHLQWNQTLNPEVNLAAKIEDLSKGTTSFLKSETIDKIKKKKFLDALDYACATFLKPISGKQEKNSPIKYLFNCDQKVIKEVNETAKALKLSFPNIANTIKHDLNEK